MHTSMDFKSLERKVWMSYYQDGLWDIYLGLLLIAIALLVGPLLEGIEQRGIRYLVYIAMLGFSWFLFWAGKRYITYPRLGRVKFSAERRKRKVQLAVILGVFVVLNIAALAFTAAAKRYPQILGPYMPGGIPMMLFVGIYVGGVMAVIAYMNEFIRGYYIAVIFALAFAGMELLNNPLVFYIGAILVGIPGLVMLARFLRSHPLPVQEVDDGKPE